jgi:hypothetical protein
MGHSFGGYSVAALITQTTRFRAAVTSAGAYDLISVYGHMDRDGDAPGVGWCEEGPPRLIQVTGCAVSRAVRLLCRATCSLRARSAKIIDSRPASLAAGVTYPIALCKRTSL